MKKSVWVTGRFAKPQKVATAIGRRGTELPECINGICLDLKNGSYPG